MAGKPPISPLLRTEAKPWCFIQMADTFNQKMFDFDG
jgi:hypothetical protein